MAYIVSNDFKQKLYDGECDFDTTLIINGNTIPQEQISSISISSPIVDDSNEIFYLGTFISQKLTIKFNNLDGLSLESGQEVSLSISQDVNGTTESVPIGLFLVDDLGENYQQTCEITCMDYGVKFKPNIDYSPCFVDGKATIDTILAYICNYFGVTLGDYPIINGDVEIGTYDSTISGKQWISYIAEIKGCNAKMDRQGRLTLQPLKQASSVSIDASQSASFELGEKYNITKIVYTDAIRNYTYGNDSGNTLFIRQDNPFITKEIMDNLYQNVFAKTTNRSVFSDNFNVISPTIEAPIKINFLKGETMQNGTPNPNNPIPIKVVGGNSILNISHESNSQSYELKFPVKNLWVPIPTQTQSLIDLTNNEDGSYTIDGYSYSNSIMFTQLVDLPIGEYTLSANNPTIDTKVRLRLDLENGTNKVLALSQANQSATYTLTSKIVSISIWIVNSPDLTNFYIKPELILEGLEPIELCKIGNYQDYFYKDSDKWYLHKEIKKIVFNGTENWLLAERKGTSNGVFYLDNYLTTYGVVANTSYSNYSTYYTGYSAQVGRFDIHYGQIRFYAYSSTATVQNWKDMLASNNLIVYSILSTPTDIEITNETLLSNLNALEEAYTYDGSTTIRNTPSSSNYFAPTYDINVYMRERYIFYSLKTRNYGDFTLDAWDNIDYDLDGNTYKTLNNNIIKVEGSIMGDYETKIPTKQQTITTNVVEENIKSVKKFAKTEIDNANAQISLKVGYDDVINAINLDTSGTQISGGKISLAGKTIEMTSDDIEINSTNFKVTKDGDMACNNATMKNANVIGGMIEMRDTGETGEEDDPSIKLYKTIYTNTVTTGTTYDLYRVKYTGSDTPCYTSGTRNATIVGLNTDEYHIVYRLSTSGGNGTDYIEDFIEELRDINTDELIQSKTIVRYKISNGTTTDEWKNPTIINTLSEILIYNTSYQDVLDRIKFELNTNTLQVWVNSNGVYIYKDEGNHTDYYEDYYAELRGDALDIFKYTGTSEDNLQMSQTRYGADTIIVDGKNILENTILWSGGHFMTGSHTATLSENVSDQPHGIVLVWSAYANGSAQDYNWHFDFIPKEFVNLASSRGFLSIMAGSKFNYVATKYVYIYDDKIIGNNDNSTTGTGSGITYTNNAFVLRYVIGV